MLRPIEVCPVGKPERAIHSDIVLRGKRHNILLLTIGETMKRWIWILIAAIAAIAVSHYIAIRGKTGDVNKLKRCSDVTTFVPSGPIERNDSPVSGQIYVVPDEKKCK